jgi:glycosyltransferase involved in cell wall biosynthesis
MASGVRTMELAKSLLKIDVEAIVFSPYEETRTTKDGVKVVKVPTFFSSIKMEDAFYYATRRAYYNRALQKLIIKMSTKLLSGRIQLSSKLHELFKKFDLDIVQAEQDNAALSLLSMRSKLNLPIVLDLHGIWSEELLAANAIKVGSDEWTELQALMRHIVKSVDLTVSLSDSMKDYVLSTYCAESRNVVVVPPGGRVLLDDYIGRPIPWKLVYAGIISYRKHVDLFIRSIPYVKERMANVEFHITRKGDLLSLMQSLAQRLKVHPNFFWFKTFDETLQFLTSCHVGVLPSTNDTSARISMPSKLFDYLSVGLPVVANDVGGWTEIVKSNNLGIVTSNDPKDFAAGITKLLENPEELAECGRRGIELIRNKYNWDISAKLLAQSYERLI